MERKFKFVWSFIRDRSDEETCMKLPQRSTEGSAGYDFYSPFKVICPSHKITMVKTRSKSIFS